MNRRAFFKSTIGALLAPVIVKKIKESNFVDLSKEIKLLNYEQLPLNALTHVRNTISNFENDNFSPYYDDFLHKNIKYSKNCRQLAVQHPDRFRINDVIKITYDIGKKVWKYLYDDESNTYYWGWNDVTKIENLEVRDIKGNFLIVDRGCFGTRRMKIPTDKANLFIIGSAIKNNL